MLAVLAHPPDLAARANWLVAIGKRDADLEHRPDGLQRVRGDEHAAVRQVLDEPSVEVVLARQAHVQLDGVTGVAAPIVFAGKLGELPDRRFGVLGFFHLSFLSVRSASATRRGRAPDNGSGRHLGLIGRTGRPRGYLDEVVAQGLPRAVFDVHPQNPRTSAALGRDDTAKPLPVTGERDTERLRVEPHARVGLDERGDGLPRWVLEPDPDLDAVPRPDRVAGADLDHRTDRVGRHLQEDVIRRAGQPQEHGAPLVARHDQALRSADPAALPEAHLQTLGAAQDQALVEPQPVNTGRVAVAPGGCLDPDDAQRRLQM